MEEITDTPSLDFLKTTDSKVPIPDPSFLRKISYNQGTRKPDKELDKHERAYDAYCRWSALPRDEREPKTAQVFERKWGLPRNYTAYFKQREGYQEKRLAYFWDWMMDKFPDVVYEMYNRAVNKGSSVDARAFAELIAKHMDIDKPKQVIQPFLLIGVPQDKVDALFTPRGYEKVTDILPGEEVKK